MTTLTETAYYARRGLKIAFFLLLGLIILRIIISAVTSFWQGISRPASVKPDVAFGKLLPIKFPVGKEPTEPIIYTPEFVGGVLPESSFSAKVYFTSQAVPSFLSLERAKEFAQKLGFKAEPVALSQTLYQWTDTEFPLKTLQKDIVAGDFKLNYDFYRDPSVLSEKELPYGRTASLEAIGNLDRHGVSSPELQENEAKVSYWKSMGSELLPVSSISEADIVRVDLFRTPAGSLPFVTPTYKEALVYFLLSGSSGKKRILTLSYNFRPLEREIFATYPLRTTKEAWEDLEKGQGFIANWGAVKGAHVTIRKVSLVYYDADDYAPYTQPVFAFEGDGGFVVYVPAVAKEWIETASGS